ncbi:hypothetical protein BCR44DRAFT_344724 [Catenaria anguillulae PL171]|uniref:Uncharacterized protein n=1 Tax=Catenaria anguillulae PL171 TaxID=765915 RepID=A0A1Y2H4G3_9FUNG|nr:hypothetical protein BCR44DRAFT_344724 [Catenaria anguillulae PL171]
MQLHLLLTHDHVAWLSRAIPGASPAQVQSREVERAVLVSLFNSLKLDAATRARITTVRMLWEYLQAITRKYKHSIAVQAMDHVINTRPADFPSPFDYLMEFGARMEHLRAARRLDIDAALPEDDLARIVPTLASNLSFLNPEFGRRLRRSWTNRSVSGFKDILSIYVELIDECDPDTVLAQWRSHNWATPASGASMAPPSSTVRAVPFPAAPAAAPAAPAAAHHVPHGGNARVAGRPWLAMTLGQRRELFPDRCVHCLTQSCPNRSLDRCQRYARKDCTRCGWRRHDAGVCDLDHAQYLAVVEPGLRRRYDPSAQHRNNGARGAPPRA